MTTTIAENVAAALTITDNAARKIGALMKKHPEHDGLRIKVRGGGCSGLQYEFAMDVRHPRDVLFEHAGVRVLVDPKSLIYVRGSQFDYVQTLMREEFTLQNPNIKSKCGCGTSFNV